MLQKSILVSLAGLLLLGFVGAQAAQHHPFSELYPPDENIDFGGKNLTNATQIETGSIIANDTDGNITFRDSTGVKTLIWNSNAVRWEVVNSDLDLNDNNNIENFFADACATDEMVRKVFPNGSYVCTPVSAASTTEDFQQTLNEGNWSGGVDLNLTGSNIEGFFSNACSGSNEVVKRVYPNGSYVCQTVPEDTGTESLNRTLLVGNIANRSISLDGNDLEAIGNLYSDSASTNFFSGGASSSETVTGITSSGSLQTSEILVGNLNIADAAVNRTQLAQSGCSGSDVLRWDGSDWVCVDSSGLGTDSQDLSSSNASNPGGASNVVHGIEITGGDDTAVVDYYVPDTTRVGSLNETLTAGNLANQSIVLAGNDIEDVGNITGFFSNKCSGANEVVKRIYKNGSYVCETIPEDAGVENLNQTLTAGNISNQSISMAGHNILDIGNLEGTDIVNNAQINSNAVTRSGGELDSSVAGEGIIYDSGWLNASDPSSSNEIQTLGEDNGTTPSGASSVTQLIDISDTTTDAAIKDYYVPDTTRVGSLNETLTVGNLANQSIVLAGNDIEDVGNITGFFSNACSGSNEVVKRVYPNGSYVCQTVPEDTGTESLNRTLLVGNIANRSISLDGNDLEAIGNLYSDSASTNFFSGGASSSETVTGITSSGSLQTSEILVGNLNIADAAVNRTQLAQSGCSGSDVLRWDGSDWVCVDSSGLGTDSQDLSSSNASNPGGASNVVHGIEITGGDDTAVVDYYVPDTTRVGSLNETLTVGNLANQSIIMAGNNITGPGHINDFFANTCSGQNEVVKRVYANGSYVCDTIPEDTGTEDLASTLNAGSFTDHNNITVNGSSVIDFNDGVRIGDVDTSTTGFQQIAIGDGVSTSGNDAVAIGTNAGSTNGQSFAVFGQADGDDSISIGQLSSTSNFGSIALGSNADATQNWAISLGGNTDASSEGAIAIGAYANAPNSYEATFGNLGTEKLDVNVTGNLTVHGSRVDFVDSNASITGYYGDACGTDEAVKEVLPNGTYVCTSTIDTGQDVEDLNLTLTEGNEANQSIDMMNNNIDRVNTVNSGGDTVSTGGNVDVAGEVQTETVDATGRMCLGDRCS